MGAAAEDLEIDFFSLVNFSDTQFANSKRKVFRNIFVMLPAILSVLEEDVTRAAANRSGLEQSIPRLREKGDESAQLRGELFNQTTLLR